MSRLLEELVSDVVVSGEPLSTTLTINGSSDLYTLLEERGDGSQGTLYKAQCGDAIVAVKILDRRPKADELERFAFWQRLDDVSGVTHLLAHGVSSLELRNYAVASDYVDGVTLEQLRAKKPLSEEAVREILLQAATVLGDIHQENVLHRDIKPSNIMIDRSGHVSITDFGAARNVDVQTLTGTVAMGTLLYVAPEQYQGKPAPASDLYSLGLTAYYLMKGEHPPMMPGLHVPRSLYFEDFDAAYSADLVSIVQKMCEHVPEKRYRNAREVLDALESKSSVLVPEVLNPRDTRIAEARSRVTALEEHLRWGNNKEYVLDMGVAGLSLIPTILGTVGFMATGAPLDILSVLIGSSIFGYKAKQIYKPFLERRKDKKELQAARSELQVLEAHVLPDYQQELTALEERVRSRRNFAFGTAAVGIGGVAIDVVGELYFGLSSFSGIGCFIIGSTLALSAGATYAAFGHTYWRMRRELKEAKDAVALAEIQAEQNLDIRDLMIQRRNIDLPKPWWGYALEHSVSLLATAAAAYTVYSGASTRQAIVNASIATGIYIAEKTFWGWNNRKERQALDDKITAIKKLPEAATLPELLSERDHTQLEIIKKAATCVGSTTIVSPFFGAFALVNYLGYTTPISSVFALTAAIGMPIIQAGIYYLTTRERRRKTRELDVQAAYLVEKQNRGGAVQTYTPVISKATEFGIRDEIYYRTMYEPVYTHSFKSNDHIMFGDDMRIRVFRKRFGEETVIISEESQVGTCEQRVYKLPFSATIYGPHLPSFDEQERKYIIDLMNDDFMFRLELQYERKELSVRPVRRP